MVLEVLQVRGGPVWLEHTQVITITQMVRLLFCCLNKQQDVTTTTLLSWVLFMLLSNHDWSWLRSKIKDYRKFRNFFTWASHLLSSTTWMSASWSAPPVTTRVIRKRREKNSHMDTHHTQTLGKITFSEPGLILAAFIQWEMITSSSKPGVLVHHMAYNTTPHCL